MIEGNRNVYDEIIDKTAVIKQELSLKNQRVNFWEKYHVILNNDSLIFAE